MKIVYFCFFNFLLGIVVCKSVLKYEENLQDISTKGFGKIKRQTRSNPRDEAKHPVYRGNQTPVKKKVEFVPGIGEVVLQDRFEPRPLFVYKKQQEQKYGSPSTASAPPPAPIKTPQKSQDLYQSPYSSYNPPKFVPDDNPGYFYPPVGTSSAEEGPKSSPSTSGPTFGPPLAPTNLEKDPMASYKNPPERDSPPNNENDDYYPQEDGKTHQDLGGPPDHPPKDENDIYYPPDIDMHGKDNMHPPEAQKDDVQSAGPPSYPPKDENDVFYPPDLHGKTNLYNLDTSYGADPHSFPQYLYDHHDHHLYEEVPHTTMAPEKEKKRVSGTHYSYYYLGRKLWYVPLYFSIYFIIYVTVLIIKSIARHKVNLKYDWLEKGRQMKSMDFGNERKFKIDHENISTAIANATEKYSDVLKM